MTLKPPGGTDLRHDHHGSPPTRYHVHVRFVPEEADAGTVLGLLYDCRTAHQVLKAQPTNPAADDAALRLDVVLAECPDPAALERELAATDGVDAARVHPFTPRGADDAASGAPTDALRWIDADSDAHEAFTAMRATLSLGGEDTARSTVEYVDFLQAFDLLDDSFETEPTIDELLSTATKTMTDSPDEPSREESSGDPAQPGDDQVRSQRPDDDGDTLSESAFQDDAATPSGGRPPAESDGESDDPTASAGVDSSVDADVDRSPDSETPDAAENSTDETTFGLAVDVDDDTDAGGETPAETTTGESSDLVEELVEQLRSPAVDDEDREALREALGLQAGESVQAQLDHVQTRLSRFDAYVDALENLLEDHGSGETIIDELSAELEATQSDVAELREELAEERDRRQQLESTVEATGERIDELDDDLEDLDADLHEELDGLDDRLDDVEDTVEDRLADVAADVDELKRSVERNTRWREQVTDAVRFDPDSDEVEPSED